MSLFGPIYYWPVVFFANVIDQVSKIARFLAITFALVLWLSDFMNYTINTLISSFNALFASMNTSGLAAANSVSFSGLDLIGYVNAFLPVSEFLGLLSIYLTAWTIVILIRWTKSIVPTLSN